MQLHCRQFGTRQTAGATGEMVTGFIDIEVGCVFACSAFEDTWGR
jgi:hypothetical protein